MLKHSNKPRLTYSKNQVAKAGHIIRKNEGDHVWAMAVIQEFRASFLYPLLSITSFISENAKIVDADSIIVRRLKRFPTILDKLSRQSLDGKSSNGIDLSRMQDVGGCRAILENYTCLKALETRLNNAASSHLLFRKKEYLQEARSSGYRGIHLVYKCFHTCEQPDDKNFPWKDSLIEVQLRTKTQHAWATAVELIDLFENTDLKTNIHTTDIQWQRFFWLVSELFAQLDGIIELEPEIALSYRQEMLALNEDLNVYSKMALFQQSFSNEVVIENTQRSSYTLMLVNKLTKEGAIYAFDDEAEAFENYAREEENDDQLVLLVAGSDFASLKKAYPNYLIDTEKFLQLLQIILFA